MKKLIFEEFFTNGNNLRAENNNIIEYAVKQLSRGRFEIINEHCETIVLNDRKKHLVIFSNNTQTEKLYNLTYSFSNEPSLQFFREQLITTNKSLISFLKYYKESFYKSGEEYKNDYWFKFYSKTKLDNGLRDVYKAEWIDYEKQLKMGSIIYDEYEVAGIWAMPYELLKKSFNNEVKSNYGDQLFVVKPVYNCKYLYDGKEIIGHQYEVKEKYDLNDFNDIGKLIMFINKIEREKLDQENNMIKKAMYNEITTLKNNNEHLFYLFRKKQRLCNLLCFLIGVLVIMILCGIL